MRARHWSDLLVVAVLAGCSGTVGTPEGITYNTLAGAGAGASSDALEVELASKVIAASASHVGELDILQANIGRVAGGGAPIAEENILLTLESADGVVLGAQTLGVAQLRGEARALPAGGTEIVERVQRLRVPRELLEQREFRANLFVCVDADADGACGDQLVEQIMGSGDYEGQQVVAFVPLRAWYDGERLSAARLRAGEQGYGGAEAFMEQTLANYDPAAFGGGADSFLVLAAHASTHDPSSSGGERDPTSQPPHDPDAPDGSGDEPADRDVPGSDEPENEPGGDDPPGDDPPGDDPPGDDPVGDAPHGEDPDGDCDLDDCFAIIEAAGEDGTFMPDWDGFQQCMAICDITERDDGCFVKGTGIAVGPGQWVPIERLRPGAMVLTGAGLARVARAVTGPEENPIVRIVTEAASLGVTRDHPMLTDAGMKRADELRPDDQLVLAGGSTTPIIALASEIYTSAVFNIALEGGSAHQVIAEGIVTGDLDVQETLSPMPIAAAVHRSAELGRVIR